MKLPFRRWLGRLLRKTGVRDDDDPCARYVLLMIVNGIRMKADKIAFGCPPDSLPKTRDEFDDGSDKVAVQVVMEENYCWSIEIKTVRPA